LRHRRHITSIGAALVLALVLCVAAAYASARATGSELARDPVVASWIDSVNRSKLEPAVDDLSGETSPLIGGSPFTILTRSSLSGTPADMAEQYVYEHLLSYGLTSVGYQSFASDGVAYRNVVGEIAGTRHPNEIVIVGPHLDSTSGALSATLAPGADDNASGVAAALYMAKVFAHQQFDRTIRFVFFDGEEVGYQGSNYYADKAKAAGETVVAMLAPDMLAYNAGSGVLGLHTREPGVVGEPADQAIAQLVIDVASTYSVTGVKPTLFADGKSKGDHASFWQVGYPAILVVQDFDQFDPRWHTPEDTVSHFVWPYYVGAAKVLLGTVACEAGLVTATPTPTPTPTPTSTPPSLTLKASPQSVKVGMKVALKGTVSAYQSPDTTVVLYRKSGASLTDLKHMTISNAGAFKTTVKATKAGKWTFVASYRAGTATYLSKRVTVNVRR